MAKHIKTSIRIEAQPKIIWDILMDFKKYPEWNPFITSITGSPQLHHHITITLPSMTFTPVIKTIENQKELKWLGHLWIKGLFDGEHQFVLHSNPDGSTTFRHNEVFNGILVPFFVKKLDIDTKKGFEQMNMALKLRAEKMTSLS